MLPLAVNGLPGDNNAKPAVQAPQLAQQPLTGLGGGETIREVHQDTPFSMVAVTAEDLTGTTARVRAEKADGSWGPWYDAETLEGVGPESAVPRGTEPGVRRPHHHGADLGHPPRRGSNHRDGDHRDGGQSTRKTGAGLCARERRAAVRTEHQRGTHQPAAGAGQYLAAAIRRHGSRTATQHHRPRAMGRR